MEEELEHWINRVEILELALEEIIAFCFSEGATEGEDLPLFLNESTILAIAKKALL